MFGKKKSKEQAPPGKPKLEPYDIRVMPQKFHKYLAVKKSGSGKLILIILLVVVVVAAIAYGGFYYMNSRQVVPTPNINQPTANLNQAINIPEFNVNTNTNENTNANENTNVNTNTNTNTNVNTNVNVNENANTNTNVNAPRPGQITVYTSSDDADKDGLTDIEEELYETEKNKPDTDEDGFTDSEEIINGFNPKAAGGSQLSTSGLVNVYNNPTFNYEILHVSGWLAKSTDSSLREIIFQSTTGEFINVLVEDNPDLLNLVNWYLKQSPLSDINSLQSSNTKQGYSALISPDKLTYYVQVDERKDKVFVITYNIGPKTKVNFLTSFAMMINSFKLVAAPAPADDNAAPDEPAPDDPSPDEPEV